MNYLPFLILILFLSITYIAGNYLWLKIIHKDTYYFNLLYCGFATICLIIALTLVTLTPEAGDMFKQRLIIDCIQSAIAIMLLIMLHKKVVWKDLLRQINKDRQFILITTIFLLVGILLGFVIQEQVLEFVEQPFESLEELANLAEGKPFWEISILLFGNNSRAAINMSLVFPLIPVIGGIYVIFSMLLNGAIIGIIGGIIDKPALYLIVGLMPHGIFEIPAIILAASIGLKLSIFLSKGIIRAIQDKERNATSILIEHLRYGTESFKVLYIVILLLIIAAILESTITPALLAYLD